MKTNKTINKCDNIKLPIGKAFNRTNKHLSFIYTGKYHFLPA